MGDVATHNSLIYMTEKFQTLIKEFDDFRSFKEKVPVDISKLDGDLKALSESLKNLIKDCSAIDSEVAANENKFRLQFDRQELSNKSFQNCIKFHDEKFDEHTLKLSNISERIGKVEDKQKACADKEQILELQDGLKIISDKISAETLSLKLDLKNAIESLTLANQNTLQAGITNKELLLKKIMDLSSDHDQLNNSLESYKKEISQFFDSFKSSINSQFSEAISSIPKPVIPSIDDAKTAMKKELEPVSLDAKNANLRSTNNENEIMILKKKIESMTLIIKKLEIEGQK